MKKRLTIMLVSSMVLTGMATFEGITNRDMTEPDNHFWSFNPMKYNPYTKGQCTNYVFDKMRAHGKQIGVSWNDAKYWSSHAQKDGYRVNSIPKVGSIMQSTKGKYGHVAYIEKKYKDGSIEVSEMNYRKPYEVTKRTIFRNEIKDYQYIHPKNNAHV
ncbi:CHAP domain-containing protein [Staphylococcus casei]|uniref:CHAP domain-containing protein n=1 Tax=Staphylococcus TaxID=1279 RepID=UPI000CD24969|nr:CHAP domain-containing protein [Staphylococcus casei]PNZ59125.1 CHAP domain-containing protein [Staphylococcus casei]PTI79743.1 CHAP domain-containing protein [Staphylococcus succinus]WJE85498.1 CHAP domain-containing protein [Staphylococcus casei]